MLRPFSPRRSRDLARTMRILLAFALALPPSSPARDDPVPPPAGTGAQVTSTLTNEMSIRFTAAGKLLRAVQQSTTERSAAVIEVVNELGKGIDGEEAVRIASKDLKLETTRAKPPYVRVRYGKCTASVEHGESTDYETPESDGRYFLERGAPHEAGVGAHDEVRQLYENTGTVPKEVALRVAIDADAFVAGPRLAPLVLGKAPAADAVLDVPPALLEPLLRQAIPDGVVTKATLRSRGVRRIAAAPGVAAPDLTAFQVATTVTWKGGDELPVTATFDLEGELELVAATAQVYALRLSGPIQYSGTSNENGAQLEVAGSGKLTFDYRAEPLPKQDGK